MCYSRRLPFCSPFGHESGKCLSLSAWPAPGVSVFESSPHIFHLLLFMVENTLVVVFHVLEGWNEAIYLRYHFLQQVSLRELKERSWGLMMIPCSFSFCVVFRIDGEAWLCCKGFKLSRLAVCVSLDFKLTHTHHSLLYSSVFTLSSHSLVLHPSVFRAGSLFSASMQFHTTFPLGWFWSLVPWFMSHVQTHDSVWSKQKNKHLFYRTPFSMQLFFSCFWDVRSHTFPIIFFLMYSNDYSQRSYCCFCM